ncbi:MAG TPA: 16S rRNA (guanine(527)-N(7))-methyltransferase RsmG [Burkholderiales bacterium]|nr:16S rRNA (guanine(527)-N(7))-methyltransferase RsmG [Burkholderiales bacterium]
MVALDQQLLSGLNALALDLPSGASERLLCYAGMLQKWNRVYNLTAIREPRRLITHHILDCLAVLPHTPPGRLVDVGTGAGLPGIPLAVARPDQPVTLLDSNHKKGAFLHQVLIDCKLSNAQVQIGRAELWKPEILFDVAISRAFADLPGFVDAALHLVRPGGSLIAMKGIYPDEELAQLPSSVRLLRVVSLDVPGLEAQRHVVITQRVSD